MRNRLQFAPTAITKCLLVMACLPLACDAELRVPITESVVADALGRAGIPTQPAQVRLPVGLVAQSEQLNLQLLSLEVLADGQVRARLTCKQAHACQPFFAVVTPAATRGPYTVSREGQGGVSGTAHELSASAQRVSAGQHAILTLEDAHMRITLPVIAIDTGEAGTEVRVTSLDRKQVYQATVVGTGLVRGALP